VEFFLILFALVVFVQVVNALGKQGQGKQLPPGTTVEAAAPEAEEGQVVRIGPFTVRLPPEARQAQAPALPAATDSWWEEAHGPAEAPDFDAVVYAPESVGLAVYEPPPEVSVAPRPLPPEPVALDAEVDRDAEHARLHARIDRPLSAAATVRPRHAPARDALGSLHDGAALRRAVLAAEVLGPPRALRALGD
jgi:Na+-transporting methylmalonyl-CoA/oxaloacetate decarboxylase gamma subunit